jgi:hypothetical protein
MLLCHPRTTPTRPRTTHATSNAQSAAHAQSVATAPRAVANAMKTRNATRHAPTHPLKPVAMAPPRGKATSTATRVVKAVADAVVAAGAVAMTVALAKTMPAETPMVTQDRRNWALRKPTTAASTRRVQHFLQWLTLWLHRRATRMRTDVKNVHETAMAGNVDRGPTVATREIATASRSSLQRLWIQRQHPFNR